MSYLPPSGFENHARKMTQEILPVSSTADSDAVA